MASELLFADVHPEGRTTSEQRQAIREIVWWLQGDLYERVPSAGWEGIDPSLTAVWQSPLKWTVLLAPNVDGAGWIGEIRKPDGSHLAAIQRVSIPWLEEHIP